MLHFQNLASGEVAAYLAYSTMVSGDSLVSGLLRPPDDSAVTHHVVAMPKLTEDERQLPLGSTFGYLTPHNTQINTNKNTNINNTQNSINSNANTAQISAAGATTALVQPISATAAPVFHQPLSKPLPPHPPHPQDNNNPDLPRHMHVKAASLDESHKMCMAMICSLKQVLTKSRSINRECRLDMLNP